jgi:hypothetical protein
MTLEQFLDMDKVKLMHTVFENEDFLKSLYQVMFWHKQPEGELNVIPNKAVGLPE